MKFSIDRDALVDVLFRVQGVCAQKSTLPILASCLIEAHDDGRISVHGTDLDVSISTTCAAKVEKSGRVAISAKRFFDTVKTAPAGEVTLATEANHWAVFDAGRVHVRIAGSHPDEFPQLPESDDNLPVTLTAGTILDLIEKTYFSISTDEARPAFTGGFFKIDEADGGSFLMVSTDGHRLSKIELAMAENETARNVPEALGRGVIVPRKGIHELRRILKGDVTVSLGIQGDDLIVAAEGMTLAVRLIPGRFPNFAQVIPQELEHKVTVERGPLLQALKRAGNYSTKLGNIRLTLEEGSLQVHAFNAEAGELSEPIPCSYNGKGVNAGYNYRYLLDVLGVIEADEVVIEVIDTESPTVIRDPSRDEALFIVMPMQV